MYYAPALYAVCGAAGSACVRMHLLRPLRHLCMLQHHNASSLWLQGYMR